MAQLGWIDDDELVTIRQESGDATLEWVNEKIGVVDNELRGLEQLVATAESRISLIVSTYAALRERKIALDTPENILDHDLEGWNRVDGNTWTYDDGNGMALCVQLMQDGQVKLTINEESHFRGIIEFPNIQEVIDWLAKYGNGQSYQMEQV